MEDAFEINDFLLKIVLSPKFYVTFITIIVSIILLNVIKGILKKLILDKTSTIEGKKRNTVLSLASNIIKYIIFILAIVVILNAWGVNITGIITGLGIAGVVAGLSLQDALKDIIMGCNLIMDNYFVVGDIVKIDDFTGEVIEFGLKNTKIKDVSGHVYIIANREISKVVNFSQKNTSVVVTIPIAYEEKESKVEKMLLSAIDEINEWSMSIKKGEYLGIDNLNSSSVDYMIKVYCSSVNQFAMRRKVLALIKSKCDNANIKIPYTQVEVHNGK